MSIINSWNTLKEHWSNKFGKEIQYTPASEIDIKRLQEYYGSVPKDYMDSLSICNPVDQFWLDELGWSRLLNIEESIKINKDFNANELNDPFGYTYIYGEIINPKKIIPKEWILIFEWNMDYFVAIDMLSDDKGQIIVFCIEDATLAKWENSYEEWFAMAVDEVIKHGELRVETIEEVLAKALK